MLCHCLSETMIIGGNGTPKSCRERFRSSSRTVNVTALYVQIQQMRQGYDGLKLTSRSEPSTQWPALNGLTWTLNS